MGISMATGDSQYHCTRGNCNDVIAGPHEQDQHNNDKHLPHNGMNENSDIPRFGAGDSDD